MITALRMLRVRYAVQMSGAEHVGDGPAIIVGNHVSLIDPPIAVASNWWRVIAFTKVEAFESPGGAFFRIMGQIPLRRGDEQCTRWAMAMAQQVLADGAKIGIYPEGTRSPDGRLHRLHKRVLVPLLQANPDVPVHVVVTRYKPRARRRTRVSIQFSPRLDVDPRSMSAEQLTEAVRDALVGTGDLEYVDEYARDVKARAAAARAARPGNART